MHGEYLKMRRERAGPCTSVIQFQPDSEGCEEQFSIMVSCEIARFTLEKVVLATYCEEIEGGRKVGMAEMRA